MTKKINNTQNELVELTKFQLRNTSGGCPEDATIFHKIGCGIATFVNKLEEDMNDGNVHEGPRNGYYF